MFFSIITKNLNWEILILWGFTEKFNFNGGPQKSII